MKKPAFLAGFFLAGGRALPAQGRRCRRSLLRERGRPRCRAGAKAPEAAVAKMQPDLGEGIPFSLEVSRREGLAKKG